MSYSGGTNISETGTTASRVLFLSSGDATVIFNNNRSNFMFDLDEDVVVPPHHSILLSLIGAEIPYSFYNFVEGRNTKLYFQASTPGVGSIYVNNELVSTSLTLFPQGNWNSVELAAFITQQVNLLVGLPENSFIMEYDHIALKFRMIMNLDGIRITLAMKNSSDLTVDMNEELGWDLDNADGDPWVERDAINPVSQYRRGYANPPAGGTGPEIGTIEGQFPDTRAEAYNYADDVADMSNSIRTLFIRSNLCSSSVMDSFVGGGFSNILGRIPINTLPGGIINVNAADGDVHKLLLKVKEFTQIHLRLTNQRNQAINLNGLNYNVSLKLEFIENKRLEHPDFIRETIDRNNSLENRSPIDLTKKKKKKTADK